MVRITSSSLGKGGGPRRSNGLWGGGPPLNISLVKLAWVSLVGALILCTVSMVSTPMPKNEMSPLSEGGGEEKLDDTEAAAAVPAGDDEVGEIEDPAEEVGGESRGGRIGRRPEDKESFTDADPETEPRRGLAAAAGGAGDVKEVEEPKKAAALAAAVEEDDEGKEEQLAVDRRDLAVDPQEESNRKKLSGTAIWASGAVAVNDDDDDETSTMAKRKKKKEQMEERDRQTDATAKRKRNMPKPWMAPKGEEAIATVAYAVSLTSCPKEEALVQLKGGSTLGDGGAVLRHSVHLNSARHPPSRSKYDYQMVAIVHPNAVSCSQILQRVGYKILVRDIPVPLSQIRGKTFREKVVKNGCCGEKEFIKLHAYTLTEYPVVVHLDLDTLIYQPMDEIFDAILETTPEYADVFKNKLNRSHEDIRSTLERVVFHGPSQKRGDALPKQIDAFFTRDYNMVRPGRKHVGVQGGFLVLRPSMEAYDHYSSVIREGNFDSQKGWGKKGFGPFYGSMTFQGIVPYYYDALHPNTAVELNRCVYNQMCDNPRDQPTINNVAVGRCRDGRVECEDCRDRPFEDVRMAHFTLCQKPWWCMNHDATRIQHRLCKDLHREWFRVRDALEEYWWQARQKESPKPQKRKRPGGSYQTNQFYGFCKFGSKKGYIPIELRHIPESFAGPPMDDAHGLLASDEEGGGEEEGEEEEEEDDTELETGDEVETEEE